MSNPSSTTKSETEVIAPQQWATFMSEFTREYRGGHATVEVLAGELGDQFETEDRPFDGISADIKDGECAIWITFGSTPQEHITHGVPRVKSLYFLPPAGKADPVIEIEGQDGTKILLSVTRPERWALEPAT